MNDQLWDTAAVAKYLVFSTKHVRDRVVCQPKFPVAVRIPTTQGRAHARWYPSEVIAWAESHRENRKAA